MKNFHTVDYVIDLFKILNREPYSGIWDLCEDFTINGHTVSVQKSTQYKHVIIDGIYQSISDSHTVCYKGVNYTALDYVKMILESEV